MLRIVKEWDQTKEIVINDMKRLPYVHVYTLISIIYILFGCFSLCEHHRHTLMWSVLDVSIVSH